MSSTPSPEFPREAFAEALRAYARGHPLPSLAARCGVRKPGYRLNRLPEEELAALFADHAAEHVEARRFALRELHRSLAAGEGDVELGAETPAAVRKRLKAAAPLAPLERARWIVRLLMDPRPEIWKLTGSLDGRAAPRRRGESAAALRRERDRAREELESLRRTHRTVLEELERTREEAGRRAEQALRAEHEVRRLREKSAREVDLRKEAEDAAEAAREAARAQDRKAEERRHEVSELRRRIQVRDAPGTGREMRELRARQVELEARHAELSRDYSALKAALGTLKNRLGDSWERRRLHEKDLRPGPDPGTWPVTAPRDADPRPAADKVRLPSDPHHWPGGPERFRRFLERIARSPYVTRVVPRSFQHPTRHGISFVTAEGDLVARVSEGDHAARILVLTTAVHRGEGEFVRRELEPLFDDRSL